MNQAGGTFGTLRKPRFCSGHDALGRCGKHAAKRFSGHRLRGWRVNLSPTQFERGNVYQAVLNAINQSGLDPCRLELEITESVLLRDDADTHDTLLKLRRLGVRIALDDFGTAYASLGYLRSFPFDKIKIDRSFVRDLDSAKRKDCIAIVSAVAALARQMHMRTVAEGIETIDQVETVAGAGCDELQGFYFSPLSRLKLSRQSLLNARHNWKSAWLRSTCTFPLQL